LASIDLSTFECAFQVGCNCSRFVGHLSLSLPCLTTSQRAVAPLMAGYSLAVGFSRLR
jgi:hypothetical protein